ncbi:unannotated protein [freshwater metagenome]|uniref:Unannotated protein n=1 Tax=freshwater metagenome TaxID=449393 RepID=A0A6J7LLN3_9ZZZZ
MVQANGLVWSQKTGQLDGLRFNDGDVTITELDRSALDTPLSSQARNVTALTLMRTRWRRVHTGFPRTRQRLTRPPIRPPTAAGEVRMVEDEMNPYVIG